MAAARKTRARQPGRKVDALSLTEREAAKAEGAGAELVLLRAAGERFARATVAVEAAVVRCLGLPAADVSQDDPAPVASVGQACLAFGPMFAGHRFAGDVRAAMAERRRATDRAIYAVKRAKRDKAKARRGADKVASPIGAAGLSEGPSAGHLRTQAVASNSVRSRTKPRHARLTGDLPAAVRGMVQRGWLSGREAAALKLFADDFELGCCMGPSGPGELRERVEGGLGVGGARGRAGQTAEAWRRYLDAKALIGRRLAGTVEAVMVQGLDLGAVDVPQKETESKRTAASALLMAAGELLERHYTANGLFTEN